MEGASERDEKIKHTYLRFHFMLQKELNFKLHIYFSIKVQQPTKNFHGNMNTFN